MSTETLMEEIRAEQKLIRLTKFNLIMSFLNDNFRTWKLVPNSKSTCITIKGVLRRHRKPRYYLLNIFGELMEDGHKHTNLKSTLNLA